MGRCCACRVALHLSFAPPKLLLSQPAEQKAAARIATGTLTVAQHKQRIGAASVKVSAAPLPVCLAAARPAPARLTRHSDAGPRLPAKKHTDCSRRPVLAGMPLTLSPAITHTRRLRSGSIRHLRSVSPSPTPLQRPPCLTSCTPTKCAGMHTHTHTQTHTVGPVPAPR